MRCPAAALFCAALFLGAPAAAQTLSRPGPWVLDVRGVTSPLPDETAFYPRLHTTAILPSRGLGLDLGVHVYLFDIGAARVGIGGEVFNVRATTKPPDPVPNPADSSSQASAGQRVRVDMRLVSPQLSFNFGAREGWSYLSAGLGPADIVTRTEGVAPGRRESGRLNALNFGGGARWFMKSHLAFGFDVRMHRLPSGGGGSLEQDTPGMDPLEPVPLPPTPGRMLLTVAVGFSVR